MLPRRSLGAAVIVVLPLVAACGAGRNTTTDKERQTPYIVGGHAGSLFVTAAALVPTQANATDASATTPSASPSASAVGLSTGPDGYLVVSIVNRGGAPDQLTGVSVQGASVTPDDASAKGLTLPPSQAVTFGDPELGGSGNALQVSGLTQPLTPGTSVPVTFQFRQAGSVTLQVLVRTSDDFGTTATATPLPLTGSYPSASEAPEKPPTGG